MTLIQILGHVAAHLVGQPLFKKFWSIYYFKEFEFKNWINKDTVLVTVVSLHSYGSVFSGKWLHISRMFFYRPFLLLISILNTQDV